MDARLMTLLHKNIIVGKTEEVKIGLKFTESSKEGYGLYTAHAIE
jgi:hypothetical protein